MAKRFLVPTDGSPVADCAVDAAIDFARACGAEIVALSVAVPEPVLQSLDGIMTIDAGREAEVLQAHAAACSAAIAQRAQRAGVPCVPIARFALDPGETIVDVAREHGCDLIVMGSHGRRGLSRLLMGSVTQAVLAYAPVPVMVLRPAPAGEAAQALARPCPAEGAA